MKKAAILFAGLALSLSFGAPAQENYPSKPITLVIPFPAGGLTDNVGRKLGSLLAAELGQPVVAENKPGAGGNIAMDYVSGGKADGYTILQSIVSQIAFNPHIYKSLKTDTIKDLAPLKIATSTPLILVAHPSLPVKTLRELLDYSRAHPGAVNYASAGTGGITHVSMELLKSKTGMDATHIPYNGAAPAMPDLLSGRVQLMMDALPQLMPLVKEGKLRVLAVSSEERSPYLPDVPTLKESGYPGLSFTTWNGLFAPARTPADVQARLRTALDKVTASKEFLDFMEQIQNTPAAAMTDEQTRQFVKSAYDNWGAVIAAAHITAE